MKRILITGSNSYIGMNVQQWLEKSSGEYVVDSIDMIDETWREKDFSRYDVVYHVAGIAHADIGNVSEDTKKMYYKVNTKLAVETASKAKREGVHQFIFMSSIIVYGGCREKVITKATQPCPANFYGDSKWQADKRIQEMSSNEFKVVIVRPPMIYGKGSKGNYLMLRKLSTRLPVFPIVKNKRSMLYINNLCEFIKLMIDNEESGIFFPQNTEYTATSDMVRLIAVANRHKLLMIPGFAWLIKLIMRMPGKLGSIVTKAFGDMTYEQSLSKYKYNYCITTLKKSIEQTEQ